jgi:hypothetical protein
LIRDSFPTRSDDFVEMGNDDFAWFGTTGSKSRLNFLELLRAGYSDYVINAEAASGLASDLRAIQHGAQHHLHRAVKRMACAPSHERMTYVACSPVNARGHPAL